MVSFGQLQPMLAETAPAPFSSAHHVFEVKWDGYRALAYVAREGVRWQSRQGKDLTAQFPQLDQGPAGLSRAGSVVDGEIVALVGRRSSFSHLRGGRGTLAFVAFDLLALDGQLLVGQPWHRRRQLLEQHWQPSHRWLLSPLVPDDGELLWRVVIQDQLEGMLAKTKTGTYQVGRRSSHWLKIVHRRSLVCVIVGILARGGRLASVGVAVRRGDQLHYLGQVGSGLSHHCSSRILSSAQPLADAAVAHAPKGESLLWVHPQQVCRVEYREITPQGRLRHPSFVRLEPQLTIDDCRWPTGEDEDADHAPGAPG